MRKYIVIALIAIGGMLLFSVGRFYVWKTIDYWQRPWAYSRDENTSLLIGKWQGNFKDPDLVEKKITLEILVPESDSARWAEAFDMNRKPDRDPNRNVRFEGKALVESRLGNEYYNVSGHIHGENGHRFQLFFTDNPGKKKVLPNFALSATDEKANWQGDKMDFATKFTFYKADGVLLYKSGDPQHNKQVEVHLNRIP